MQSSKVAKLVCASSIASKFGRIAATQSASSLILVYNQHRLFSSTREENRNEDDQIDWFEPSQRLKFQN